MSFPGTLARPSLHLTGRLLFRGWTTECRISIHSSRPIPYPSARSLSLSRRRWSFLSIAPRSVGQDTKQCLIYRIADFRAATLSLPAGIITAYRSSAIKIVSGPSNFHLPVTKTKQNKTFVRKKSHFQRIPSFLNEKCMEHYQEGDTSHFPSTVSKSIAEKSQFRKDTLIT